MNTQTLHKHRGWGKDLGSYKIPDSDVNWPGCPSWPSYMASSDAGSHLGAQRGCGWGHPR